MRRNIRLSFLQTQFKVKVNVVEKLLDIEDHSGGHLGKKPCPIQMEKKVCFSKFPSCTSGGIMIFGFSIYL